MGNPKSERPPGGSEATVAEQFRQSQRPNSTASPPRSQQLARVEVEHGAVEVTDAPDAPGSFTVRTLARWSDDDTWQPFGQSWTAPVYLLDAVIEALQRSRAAIGEQR